MKCHIDEFLLFRSVLFVRGWALSDNIHIELIINNIENKVIYKKTESSDLADIFGAEFKNNRFEFNYDLGDLEISDVKITLKSGNDYVEINPIEIMTSSDNFFKSKNIFNDDYSDLIKGTVLELGSRARSGITRKGLFKEFDAYIGLDILEGENVDVIGDAHKLSNIFEPNSIDNIFSVSVFEHLINPLRVVYEMNKVLKVGGYCQINTHQTWPIHDSPWDFFRFSKYAWYGLFNKMTGFEVIDSIQGEPCFTAPILTAANHKGLDYEKGYLSSKVIVKKIENIYVDIPYDQSYMESVYPY